MEHFKRTQRKNRVSVYIFLVINIIIILIKIIVFNFIESLLTCDLK